MKFSNVLNDNACSLGLCLFHRDHLCNLYGPGIVSQEGNPKIVLRYIPESEDDSLAGKLLLQLVNITSRKDKHLFVILLFLLVIILTAAAKSFSTNSRWLL